MYIVYRPGSFELCFSNKLSENKQCWASWKMFYYTKIVWGPFGQCFCDVTTSYPI